MNYKGLRIGAVIIATGCMLIFVSLNDARGADWVHYGADKLGNNLFYDRESIQDVPMKIIKVWTKTVVSDEGRAFIINDYKKRGQTTNGLEALREISDLWFIDCEDKRFKITQTTYYSNDGHVLSAMHFDDDRWSDVKRKSMAAVLRKILCKKPKVQSDKELLNKR